MFSLAQFYIVEKESVRFFRIPMWLYRDNHVYLQVIKDTPGIFRVSFNEDLYGKESNCNKTK